MEGVTGPVHWSTVCESCSSSVGAADSVVSTEVGVDEDRYRLALCEAAGDAPLLGSRPMHEDALTGLGERVACAASVSLAGALLLRPQDAELVALRICEYDPAGAGAVLAAQVGQLDRAECQQPMQFLVPGA